MENELLEGGEHLPAYDTSMMDVVLDIGPEAESAPSNMSDYIIQVPHATLPRRAHPLPPAYEQEEEPVEMNPVQPPPAYLNTPVTNNR